ncbi:MAG: hypothetical protein NC218_11355 [Acetobacter sp.]|nr:hypothetical protein [Acetobacter sp.]
MKLKNIEMELEFIRSATARELIAHIKANHFSHTRSEKELIKRDNIEAIVLYIHKYGLQSGARICVFRSTHLGLIQLLLAEGKENPEIISEFLTHGRYHPIRQYLQTCEEDLSEIFPEQQMLERCNPEELLYRIKHRRLTPFAKYELIRRNNPLITRAIIAQGRLNEREKLAIIEYAEWEEVNYLIECEKKPEQQRELKEMQFIRFSSPKKLGRITSHHRFSKNAEIFFFQHGDFTTLVRYIKHYNVEGGHEIIISRAGPTEILKYLSKNQLCEKGEKMLLDRGKHREIKTYIKSHCFSEENETRFIKRGRHNEIMLYISRHSLCDTAQQELMYRRNSVEIEYFVSHYPLADIAETALLKCATPETIRVWQENIPFYQG